MVGLLHCCCGPCATFPVRVLSSTGAKPVALFYNPNIYPAEEYLRREKNFIDFCRQEGIQYEVVRGSHEEWRDFVEPNLEAPERCRKCYSMRLAKSAELAKAMGLDWVSSSLLVSPYQLHELVAEELKKSAAQNNVADLYMDFRVGYRRSREIARGLHLYMQKHCGCEFSIKDGR